MRNTLVVLCSIAILIAGCTSASDSAQPGALHVLATETFLGDIAQNVAGQRIHFDILLTPGIDPHEFQPAPQDAIKIDQSQVLIVNGLGYETWLSKSLQDAGAAHQLVVATAGLTPNPDPSGEHPAGDPHMWMDPLKVLHYVENIRDGLSKADPAGKDIYAANAAAYMAKLKDLDAWIKAEVVQVPPEKRLLVTNHDALGYFAQAYGFKVVGAVIPSVSNDSSPSAQQMAALIDTIKSSGAPAIFLDISENQKLAQQIASESKARVITDLYVETLSASDGPAATYIDMLKHDVAMIVQALK
ncbi:MAG: metal ABC transporter solute-binding protein, Zn/Mn family [Ktedonobacterales bacterium]